MTQQIEPHSLTYDLRTNDLRTPKVIDSTTSVMLAWKLNNSEHDEIQSIAVKVRKSTPSGEIEVWQSQELPPNQTNIELGSENIEPVTDYEWTVSSTFKSGIQASTSSTFSTCPLSINAAWISRNPHPWFAQDGALVDQRSPRDLGRSWRTMYSQPPLQLRSRFTVPDGVFKAKIFASAKGVYRNYLNGNRIGTDELTPGWTSYQNRIDFQGYDVTDLLKSGENIWAAEVADGWWSGYVGYHTRKQAEQYGSQNAFIGELHLQMFDGSCIVYSTDTAWEEKYGFRVMSDLLMGEFQDFTVATTGWKTGGDTQNWRPVVSEKNFSHLVPQIAEPMQVVKEITPVSIQQNDKAILVDFGQNLVGRVQLNLCNSKLGDIIRIRHGEMLDGGKLYTDNLRSAEATDVVVSSGGDVTFEPAFTLHGFRFVSIECENAEVTIDDVKAQVISSNLPIAGSVRTSSPLINQLISNIEWSQRGNFVGIPTDCNQRDERLGWTADAQIFAPTAALNSDVKLFFTSWLQDLMQAQRADGCIPDVAPIPPTSNNFDEGAPAWGDAATIIPWHLYKVYGDKKLLGAHFDMMKKWVDYVASKNPNEGWTNSVGNNYGDWLSVNADTPKPLVSFAYRIRSVDIVSWAAGALGITEVAEEYKLQATKLRQQFAENFVSTSGKVFGETQTGYLFTLAWDLAPEELRSKLSENLVANIRNNENLLSTGFLGVNLLCPTLTKIGHSDLAIDLLLEERFPSWGYSISQGATTIWERWDGWTKENGFHTPTMNSFNHYSLGSVGEWIYRYLAGIDQAEDSIAYEKVLIQPIFTDRLEYVEASYESVRGTIASSWRTIESGFEVSIELPPGVTGELVMPDGRQKITSGKSIFTVTK